jgi:cytidylate kinase
LLVAIDGPAGAGKSTVARELARRLGFTYLDSGAMYRCVALLALAAPQRAPGELAREARIELSDRVLLDGRDVTAEIRTPEVSEAASGVAADPAVREALVAKQRELIGRGDWVAEGRDIGTVVAPDAALKVYLTADPAERARRRAAELGAEPGTVLAEQTMRDQRDSAREHSPLRPAPGALSLDTTGLGIDEVVERIAALARAEDDRQLDFRPGMEMRWEITRSAADTAGDLFEATNWIGPGMAGPPLHVHPTAEESYEVIEGALDLCVDGTWKTIRAGESATAPAGVPHTLRNATEEPVRIVNVHRPALRFESMFREMQALIAQGKIKALPPKEPRSAIYVAMLFAKYSNEIRVVKPPSGVFKLLAIVGRVLGFKLEA